MAAETKDLDTLAEEGWVKVDSASDYTPSRSGYSDCSAVKSLLGKCNIPCIIVYDTNAKTINKFQVYVPKEQYEKAAEIAKKGV